jgi:beta-galactosidase
MEKELNYGWNFQEGFLQSWIEEPLSDGVEVDIPHCVKRMPVNHFSEKEYQGIYSYEKNFDIHPMEGKRYFLRFDGIMLQADIYLNGHNLGHYLSGWVKVEVEITSHIQEHNRLLVVVNSFEDEKVPPFGKAVDYLTFGGIYRGVYLLVREKNFIQDVQVIKADRNGIQLKTTLTVDGEKPVYKLYDKDMRLVVETKTDSFDVPSAHLWSIDDPYLYTLVVSIPSDEKKMRIGLRTIELDNRGILLNGKRIRILGLNRHQNFPGVGPALPKAAQEEDALLIKKMGCNLIRTSHYPQSEDFLNKCDEIGLLVQSEVPGWQFISKENEWRENFLYFIREMALKERNHPSLLSYGVRVDESIDDDELYSKANEICHQLDPNRLTTGVRNFKTSHCLEDYYGYNDFSCAGLSHGLDHPKSIKGAKGKPVLDTEHNGHMFPTKMYDPTDRRIEHALRHLRVIDDSLRYPNYLGAIGWCAFDYNTHQDFGSGDHVCYHGVADIYRNFKDAGYAYMSQGDNLMMHVSNVPVSGDQDEALVKPFVVFSNCDMIKLYRNGKYIADFYPNKKDFPHLRHAPFFIDDFIGETFEEGLTPKESRIIKDALNYVGRVGMAHVEKRKLLRAVMILLRRHLDFDTVYSWYMKYISSWGEKANSYRLVGYKDGKETLSKTVEPSLSFDYQIEASKKVLINEETYDVSRVSILYVDQNGIQQHYSFLPLRLETQGPVEILSDELVTLQGGSFAVYVRSHRVEHEEKAKLIIHTNSGDKIVEFTVR